MGARVRADVEGDAVSLGILGVLGLLLAGGLLGVFVATAAQPSDVSVRCLHCGREFGKEYQGLALLAHQEHCEGEEG